MIVSAMLTSGLAPWRQAKWRGLKIVAAKGKEGEPELFAAEARIFAKAGDHPNLVHLYGKPQTRQDSKVKVACLLLLLLQRSAAQCSVLSCPALYATWVGGQVRQTETSRYQQSHPLADQAWCGSAREAVAGGVWQRSGGPRQQEGKGGWPCRAGRASVLLLPLLLFPFVLVCH